MGGDDADDVAGEEDDESVSSDASFSAHLDSGSARVFCTPSLRPKQTAAVKGITIHPDSKGRLLVVDRTGGGRESLILYMTAICIAGITLVIITQPNGGIPSFVVTMT